MLAMDLTVRPMNLLPSLEVGLRLGGLQAVLQYRLLCGRLMLCPLMELQKLHGGRPSNDACGPTLKLSSCVAGS